MNLEQLKNEFYSSYLYLAMSAYCEAEDLPGFANFFKIQAMEELTHCDKFFAFIVEAGGRPRLKAIEEPPGDFGSPADVFAQGLDHERKVTRMINELTDLAIADSNHATRIFLQWFVTEQVEEEANFSAWLAKVRRVEGDGRGLLMLDQELAQRVFVPPAASA